jgi:hypothetical protein
VEVELGIALRDLVPAVELTLPPPDVRVAALGPVVSAPVLSGTVLAPLTITVVVPSMTVVEPWIEKFGYAGIVVGPAITNSVVPSMTVK